MKKTTRCQGLRSMNEQAVRQAQHREAEQERGMLRCDYVFQLGLDLNGGEAGGVPAAAKRFDQ